MIITLIINGKPPALFLPLCNSNINKVNKINNKNKKEEEKNNGGFKVTILEGNIGEEIIDTSTKILKQVEEGGMDELD